MSVYWYRSIFSLFCLCVLKSGFSLPHSLSSYPLMGSALPDPSHYTQLSHHSLHQPQKSDSSLVGSNAPWDMDSIIQPIIGLTGAPGYQSGNSHSGMALHFSFLVKWHRNFEPKACNRAIFVCVVRCGPDRGASAWDPYSAPTSGGLHQDQREAETTVGDSPGQGCQRWRWENHKNHELRFFLW